MLAEAPSESGTVVPTKEQFEALVYAATRAPSADNNQPWRFRLKNDGVVILSHDKARALPSDGDGMFDLLSLGAALENLCIEASKFGLATDVRVMAENNHPIDVAAVGLKSGALPDPLATEITRRHTCRKPFARVPVSEVQLSDLGRAAENAANVRLHWVSDRRRILALASLVASADRLRFEHEPFHTELFRQLRFTHEEAERTGDGLDVRCLEIGGAAVRVLRWLRHWPRLRLLNRLGMSRLLTLPSAVQVWRTGTVGVLTSPTVGRAGYLAAGRALQRVWLTASRLGLSFHPLGSLPVFLKQIGGEGVTRSLAGRFYELLPDATGTTVMVFRLGHSAGTAARSFRLPSTAVRDVESP